MNTDSQGRPLSDDGQWAWNGTEWIPATGASAPAPAGTQSAGGEAGATTIAPSPLATNQGYGPSSPQPYPPVSGQPQKSRTPLILAIVAGVVVIAAVVVALVLTLGGDDKPAQVGAYTCSVAGFDDKETLTLAKNSYTITNGKGGDYAFASDKLTFSSGDLKDATGTFKPSDKSVTLVSPDGKQTVNCARK